MSEWVVKQQQSCGRYVEVVSSVFPMLNAPRCLES